jgi:hypothetical protein
MCDDSNVKCADEAKPYVNHKLNGPEHYIRVWCHVNDKPGYYMFRVKNYDAAGFPYPDYGGGCWKCAN